jgi:hypothetical protein
MMTQLSFVAHHLELVLLPAEDRLLDQHLVDRRHVEAPARTISVELLAVVGDAAARAAQRERRPDDAREADLSMRRARLRRPRSRPPSAGRPGRSRHRLLEQLAVLGHLDGLAVGADQLDAVLVEDPGLVQRPSPG